MNSRPAAGVFLAVLLAVSPGCRKGVIPAGGRSQRGDGPPKGDLIRDSAAVAWTEKVRGAPSGDFSCSGSVVFTATEAGVLYAHDAVSGRRFREITVEKGVECVCTAAGTLVLCGVGLRGNSIRAFSSRTLEPVWEVRAGAVSGGLCVCDSVLYAGTADGTAVAVSLPGGEVLWRTRCQGGAVGGCSPSEGAVYVHTIQGKITSLDASAGTVLWASDCGGWTAGAPVPAGGLILTSVRDGLQARRKKDGTVMWQTPAEGRIFYQPAADSSSAYVCTSSGYLYRIRLHDGTVQWRRDAHAPPGGAPALVGGVIVISFLDGSVRAFSANTGEMLWTAPMKGRGRGTPVMCAGTLITGSEYTWIYGLRPPGRLSGE